MVRDKAVLLVLGLLGLALCAPAQRQYGQNYALIIGAPTFGPDGKVIAEPAGPKNDALSVARTIEAKFGFRKENVVVLTGRDAVPERISAELSRLRLGGSHHLLVYVSDRNEPLRRRGGSAATRGIAEEIAANNEAVRKQGQDQVPQLGDLVDKLREKVSPEYRAQTDALRQQVGRVEAEVAQLRAENRKMADQLGITGKVHSSPVFIGPGRRVDAREILNLFSLSSTPILLVFDTPHFTDWLPSRYENGAGRSYPGCFLGPKDPGGSKDAVAFDGVEHGAFTALFLMALTKPHQDWFSRAGECRSLKSAIYPGQFDSFMAEERMLEINVYDPFDEKAFDRALKWVPFFAAPSAGGRDLTAPSLPLEGELADLASGGGSGIGCEPSQPSYRAGERTVLTCEAPADGYVAVLSYGEGDAGATLLLPNRYQPSGKVSKGTFQIPAEGERWGVQNSLPPGADRQQQAMIVLFSETPFDPTSLGSAAGIFRNLNAGDTRALRSQTVVPASYDAAVVQFPIVK
jgi:hypothetical protein